MKDFTDNSRINLLIEKVVYEIIETVSQKDDYDYEIITINDCSPDRVYDVLIKLASGCELVFAHFQRMGKSHLLLRFLQKL